MSKEKQIEEMIETLKKCSCVYTDCEQECSQCSNEELYDEALNHIARTLYEAGYRKNVIELPCKVGDLVHFKGLETPWKVSAIHIYEEGQPQISITSETGKITSTMTANEFYMFCFVIADAKMKGGAE